MPDPLRVAQARQEATDKMDATPWDMELMDLLRTHVERAGVTGRASASHTWEIMLRTRNA